MADQSMILNSLQAQVWHRTVELQDTVAHLNASQARVQRLVRLLEQRDRDVRYHDIRAQSWKAGAVRITNRLNKWKDRAARWKMAAKEERAMSKALLKACQHSVEQIAIGRQQLHDSATRNINQIDENRKLKAEVDKLKALVTRRIAEVQLWHDEYLDASAALDAAKGQIQRLEGRNAEQCRMITEARNVLSDGGTDRWWAAEQALQILKGEIL